MDEILKYIKDNKDLLDLLCCSGLLVAIGGVLWRFFKRAIEKYYTSKKRQDTSPFEIIQPHNNVLKAILGGDDHDPLATRNITYQKRVNGRDVCSELEELLNKQRYVLLLGKTGLGKTREAVRLAQKLSDEGWSILNLQNTAELDAPAKFPKDLHHRKLVFFLDELNNKINVARREQSSKAFEPFGPMYEPLQIRLLRALNWYEDAVTRDEIRVIATARNETVPQRRGDPSEWEKLGVDKFPQLWKRFEPYYNLPEPEDEAIVGVLEDTVPTLDIQAEPEDYPAIAHKNDRTFANVIKNLERVKSEGIKLTVDSYEPTLQGSWESRYRKVFEKYPVAKYIYDAVELLRIFNIELMPETVRASASLIAGGNPFKRIWHWWSIRSAMKFLIPAEHILQPADGQIEAKGTLIEWKFYLPHLYKLILSQAKQYPKKMISSLIGFSLTLWEQDQLEQVETLYKRILQINP